MARDTVIEDNVKPDALVHIGYDVHIDKNVEISAGRIVAGFVQIGKLAFIGLNACACNRIVLGEKRLVGIGSTVMKNVGRDV